MARRPQRWRRKPDGRVIPRGARHLRSSLSDPTLTARNQTIKLDVNLGLAPVTLTDLLNRPVIGLEKENFEVFAGKEVQDIRHFSGEDIPISLGAIFDTSGSTRSTAWDRELQTVAGCVHPHRAHRHRLTAGEAVTSSAVWVGCTMNTSWVMRLHSISGGFCGGQLLKSKLDRILPIYQQAKSKKIGSF